VSLPPSADVVHEEYVTKPGERQGEGTTFGAYEEEVARSNGQVF